MAEKSSTTYNDSETEPVILHINDYEVKHWMNVKMRWAVDEVSSFSFTAPFDPLFVVHRDMYRPLQYQTVKISVGGETKITGTVLEIQPQATANETLVTVTGYGLPGALNDCTMPKGRAKEYRNATLPYIAGDICDAFGLKLTLMLPSAIYNKTFDKVALEPDAAPYEFLADLAKQCNSLISDTEDGGLLIWQPQQSGVPPRARFFGPAVTSMGVQTNAQEYYSDMIGVNGTKKKRKGDMVDYRNPLLPRGLIRPSAFRIADAKKEDAYGIARGRIGRMFANAASWSLPNVASWKDPEGRWWEANTLVSILAEKLMIYRETEFLIRSLEWEAQENSRTSAFGLVLPEVFAETSTPTQWPWDD